jgi:hypothetical protein
MKINEDPQMAAKTVSLIESEKVMGGPYPKSDCFDIEISINIDFSLISEVIGAAP